MHTEFLTPQRFLMVRADPGEDLLQVLEGAVKGKNIQNGAILSGVGSLTAYHVHVAGTPSLPTTDEHFRGEGAFDIVSLTGAILGGKVHPHMTFANEQKAMGGHVHEGCTVLTFAIILIAELSGPSLAGWDTSGAWSEIPAGQSSQ